MRELRRQKGGITPDMTPLIDVVFQLLIFFMLVTTFSQYSKFDMFLPKSNVEVVEKPEMKVELVIDSLEKYYIKVGEDVKEIPKEEIEKNVMEVMEGRADKTLTISADKDLKYEKVIETMGRLKNIGVEKLEINTIK